MPRPDKTFLIESGAIRLRIDLRRSAKGYALERVLSAPPAASASSAIEDAYFVSEGEGALDTAWVSELLRRRPRPAPETSVLTSRTAALVVEMPGLGEAGWESALELEAGSITGLSGSEAMLASTRLPAEEGILKSWIVQAPLRELVALREAVAATRHSRLVAVGHPGGVRLRPGAAQLECWPGLALFHRPGSQRIDLDGWTGTEATAEALESPEVAESLEREGALLLLADATADKGFAAPGGVPEILDLRDPAVAERWAERLAAACDPLGGRLLGMPLVAVPKPPLSSAALAARAAAFALLALALAGGHYAFGKLTEKRLADDLARLKAPAEKLAADTSRAGELRKQLAELQKGDASTSTDPAGADVDALAHRARMGRLLSGVAAGTLSETVLVSMRPDGLATRLEGIASTPTGAQSFATKVDAALAPAGWRAALVRRTAKLIQGDGGPWSFEILVSPAPGRAAATASAPEAKAAATLPASVDF